MLKLKYMVKQLNSKYTAKRKKEKAQDPMTRTMQLAAAQH